MKRSHSSRYLAPALRPGPGSAPAQSYPSRPIRFLTGNPPGGAADFIARIIGQPLGVRLGQDIVIDNRPGANGNISAEVVAKAQPDGYTLLYANDRIAVVDPHIYRDYVQVMDDLVPVATIVSNQLVLAVNPRWFPSRTSPPLSSSRASRPQPCSMRRSATAATTISPWRF